MSKPYESLLRKARGLIALADPANNAPEGERQSAQKTLDELVARYGLDLSALDESKREWHTLLVKTRFRDQTPRPDKQLALFARVCLAYVLEHFERPFRIFITEEEIPTRGLTIKMRRLHAVEAMVTNEEFHDWRDCFEHYAPDLYELLRKRRAAVREAKSALDHTWSAFCDTNDIIPPLPVATRPKDPSLNQRLAAMLAAKGIQASATWSKSGKLTDKPLLP
jgi:hypothetical protein